MVACSSPALVKVMRDVDIVYGSDGKVAAASVDNGSDLCRDTDTHRHAQIMEEYQQPQGLERRLPHAHVPWT